MPIPLTASLWAEDRLRQRVEVLDPSVFAEAEVALAEPGLYDGGRTYCEATDWMDVAAKSSAPATPQVNKRSDQVFSALLGAEKRRPCLTSIATGVGVFPYALDNISGETKLLSAFNDLALSEYGIIACKRDSTHGQTLLFESRHTRSAASALLVTLNNTMHELDLPGSAADIINAVKVTGHPRLPSAGIVVAKIDVAIPTAVPPNGSITLFLDYTDPVQRDTKIGATAQVTPASGTDFVMNTAVDGSGSNVTSWFRVSATYLPSKVKLVVANFGTVAGFVTTLQLRGTGIYSLNAVSSESVDNASVTKHGRGEASIDMIFEGNPSVVASAATYIRSVYKDPLAQVRVVRFIANQSATLLTAGITGDISHRVAVVETVNGLLASTEYHINGVEHEIDGEETTTVAWWLTPANVTRFFQLGIAGADELGGGAVLGF